MRRGNWRKEMMVVIDERITSLLAPVWKKNICIIHTHENNIFFFPWVCVNVCKNLH